MKKFDKQYTDLVRSLLPSNAKTVQINKRTGSRVTAMLHTNVQHDMKHGMPLISMRMVWPHIAMAELLWTIGGEKNVVWLSRYSKMWSKFSVNNEVEAAYGWRWRKAFGRDQLNLAVEAIRRDESDRQVVVMAWDSREDALGSSPKKNVPCPLGFSLQVVDGRLNMHVFQRSCDVVCGLPYDMMMYGLLLQLGGEILGLVPGLVTFSLSHVHMYEVHWKRISALCPDRKEEDPATFAMDFLFGVNSLTQAVQAKDALVKRMRKEHSEMFKTVLLRPPSPIMEIVE